MKETDICSVCGESHPLNQLTGFSSQLLCPGCLGAETGLLFPCLPRLELLCPGCLGAETVLCTSCGEIIRSTDTDYAGDSRDDSLCCCQDRKIQDYSYKPNPIFYGSDSRYFGVELEINCAGKDSENACRLMRLANQDRELLCYGSNLRQGPDSHGAQAGKAGTGRADLRGPVEDRPPTAPPSGAALTAVPSGGAGLFFRSVPVQPPKTAFLRTGRRC